MTNQADEKTLLSIAVPAYNAAATLQACLDSLVADLSAAEMSSIQVVIIDDGSTDNTASIAARFAAEHPDSVQLLRKPNGGHGSGINAALTCAHGRYFKVVDADDWLAPGSLSQLLAALAESCADVVLTEFHTVDASSGQRIAFTMSGATSGVPLSLEEFWRLGKAARSCLNFHGVCYRTEVLRTSKTVLPEHISYEDLAYATVPFRCVQTVLPLRFFLYEYQVGQASQSVSDTNKLKGLGDLETVLVYIHQAYSSAVSLTPSQRAYFLANMAELLLDYYTICLLKNPNRPAGRQLAKEMRQRSQALDSDLYRLSQGQYRRLRLLAALGVNAAVLGHLKASPLYHLLRRLIG